MKSLQVVAGEPWVIVAGLAVRTKPCRSRLMERRPWLPLEDCPCHRTAPTRSGIFRFVSAHYLIKAFLAFQPVLPVNWLARLQPRASSSARLQRRPGPVYAGKSRCV